MRRLERHLGPVAAVALSLGTLLGSGLFVLPGVAAGVTGPSMWLGYLLAGLSALPAVLCKAELSTAMATSGGTYVYIERAFGPLAGTLAGVGAWLLLLLKSAFALIGMSWYLHELVELPARPTALVALAAIVVLNLVGVRKVGRAQTVMVGISVVGLVALVLYGLGRGDASLRDPFLPHGYGGVIEAMAVVYISYAGVTNIAAVAEEIRDPGRNLPLAMVMSLAVATLLYVAVTRVLAEIVSTHATVGAGGLIGDFHPLYTFADRLGGRPAGLALAVLGTLTMAAMANAGVLAASRFPFAMSRDRLLPPVFTRVHPRYMTPITCILATGAMMAVALATLDIVKIAKLASAVMLLEFGVVSLAVLVMREVSPQWYRPGYRAPLYPVLPVVGVLLGVMLLYGLGWPGAASITAVFVPAVLLWWTYGRRHAGDRGGALHKAGPREDLLTGTRSPSGVFAAYRECDVGCVCILVDDTPPEPMVELGAALAGGREVAVFHVVEVPEQLDIDEFGGATVSDLAIERRVRAMGRAVGAHLYYEGVLCRDLRLQVMEIAEELSPDWILFRWQELGRHAVFFRHPLAWLTTHLPCNVGVFRDNGVRVFDRVLVRTSGGHHDWLLARTADMLADMHGGEITFVGQLAADASDHHVHSTGHYQTSLTGLVRSSATSQLIDLSDPLPRLSRLAAEHDLLVIEHPVYQPFSSHFVRTLDDRFIDAALCSVLRLRVPRAPELAASAGAPPPDGETLLVENFDRDLVMVGIAPARKRDLFAEIAAHCEKVHRVPAAEVLAALWHHERRHNSYLAAGIAMPRAIVEHADRFRIGVAVLREPIDYNTADGALVEVAFFCIGPASGEHGVPEAMWLAGQELLIRVDLAARLQCATCAGDVVECLRDTMRQHAANAVREDPANGDGVATQRPAGR